LQTPLPAAPIAAHQILTMPKCNLTLQPPSPAVPACSLCLQHPCVLWDVASALVCCMYAAAAMPLCATLQLTAGKVRLRHGLACIPWDPRLDQEIYGGQESHLAYCCRAAVTLARCSLTSSRLRSCALQQLSLSGCLPRRLGMPACKHAACRAGQERSCHCWWHADEGTQRMNRQP
jgi:hypothetical protein